MSGSGPRERGAGAGAGGSIAVVLGTGGAGTALELDARAASPAASMEWAACAAKHRARCHAWSRTSRAPPAWSRERGDDLVETDRNACVLKAAGVIVRGEISPGLHRAHVREDRRRHHALICLLPELGDQLVEHRLARRLLELFSDERTQERLEHQPGVLHDALEVSGAPPTRPSPRDRLAGARSAERRRSDDSAAVRARRPWAHFASAARSMRARMKSGCSVTTWLRSTFAFSGSF